MLGIMDDSGRKILLVDDEALLTRALQEGLVSEGYKVAVVQTGEEALFALSRAIFDLVILDVMLPGRSGLEVAKIVRGKGDQIPILMLTAKDTVEDCVAGLDGGADDYLVKPFAFAELMARVRALLKRSQTESTVRLSFSDLEMDLVAREVRRNRRNIDLTVREFEILEYLLRHRNEVVSREMLARDVWKEAARVTPLDNVIDVHMARLRRKVDHEADSNLIHTVRGVGFTLRQNKK